jgi:predicted nucleic acid-binding protein
MSAGDRFFVDSNVLLYSVGAASPAKQQAARLWVDVFWETGSGALSLQVLHEFYVNTVRKVRVPQEIARQPPEVTIGSIHRAWHWSDQAQLSYCDGLILATAERSECPLLLSEDFQIGLKRRQDLPKTRLGRIARPTLARTYDKPVTGTESVVCSSNRYSSSAWIGLAM